MSKRHPSGRPIREANRRGWNDGCNYSDGFRLPRLRRASEEERNFVNAIGFTAEFPPETDECYTWGRRK